MNTKIIKLDINKKLYETISAKQGDTESRFLLFHIFDSSLPFDLREKSVRVYGIKPDDTKVFNDLVINDAEKGYCTLELTNQILAIAGLVKLELVIYNGNKKLSSIPFVLNVISSLNSDDAVISTNEFTALMNGLAALSEYDIYKSNAKQVPGIKEEVSNLSSQLDEIKNNIMPNYLSELLIEEITQPNNEFAWFKHKIYRNKNGEIYTDLKIEEYKNKGGTTYYVDILNGSERNDGLTIDTPFKYLKTAMDKTDVGTIYVKDGFYNYSASFNSTTYSKNINIIGIGENVVCCYGTNSLSWGKVSNYNNIYKAERSILGGVFDKTILTKTGDYTKYSTVTSLSDVENNEGSYYYENNIIYIHPFNSRIPDDNIIVMLQGGNLKITGNYKVYLENIKFYGGANGCVNINNSSVSDNTLLVAKDCEFKYSTNGVGGLQIQGADAILENCIASSNLKDGFNYHAYNNRINRVVEINCIGRDNGESLEVSYSDNGSTMHDGGKIIRINGKYFNNLGPNVADVGLGTMVWNLGCASYKSKCGANTHNCDYWCGDSTKTVKMWLDTCISFNSLRSCYVGENSELYYKNSIMKGEIVTNNNSIFEEY